MSPTKKYTHMKESHVFCSRLLQRVDFVCLYVNILMFKTEQTGSLYEHFEYLSEYFNFEHAQPFRE